MNICNAEGICFDAKSAYRVESKNKRFTIFGLRSFELGCSPGNYHILEHDEIEEILSNVAEYTTNGGFFFIVVTESEQLRCKRKMLGIKASTAGYYFFGKDGSAGDTLIAKIASHKFDGIQDNILTCAEELL